MLPKKEAKKKANECREHLAVILKEPVDKGRDDCTIALVIPGKWPRGGKKRLDGRAGPLGIAIGEYEDAVLCTFAANDVVAYCARFLPTLTIRGEP